MSHRTTSGLQHQQQHQNQTVWQDTTTTPTTGTAAILDNHFINDIFDRGPPLSIQSHSIDSPGPLSSPQPTNFIHHLPQTTRGIKSHRYMTRQTQQLDQNHINGPLPPAVFRPLPFYDKSCFLILPTALESRGVVGKPNESLISFRLTVEQADFVAMASDKVNIILRFCHLDPSTEQDDNFPPDITITVNGSQVALPPAISNPNRPGVPAKRPGQHVDITKLCKLCPFVGNNISLKWFVDPTNITQGYATTIIIGEKVSPEDLLNRIKDRGLSDPEETKKFISDSDSEVATTNLQCSLMCPLGKMKMTAPCKSVKCQHITCFDASIYLQMNEKKATWICPVCAKPAYYPDLVIDGYFTEILQNTAPGVSDVTLNLDGSWSAVLKMEQQSTTKNPPPEIITISSDEDD